MSDVKPISFSAPMVPSLIAGTKTQTRRVVGGLDEVAARFAELHAKHPECKNWKWAVGDRLWVRESYYQVGHWEQIPGVKTKGGRQKWKFVPDTAEIRFEQPGTFRKGRHSADPGTIAWHKRLARFMPWTASRITIEITQVRVERLNAISEEDAIAEGIEQRGKDGTVDAWKIYTSSATTNSPILSYQTLWESINGGGSWSADPFVWVINFRKL